MSRAESIGALIVNRAHAFKLVISLGDSLVRILLVRDITVTTLPIWSISTSTARQISLLFAAAYTVKQDGTQAILKRRRRKTQQAG